MLSSIYRTEKEKFLMLQYICLREGIRKGEFIRIHYDNLFATNINVQIFLLHSNIILY